MAADPSPFSLAGCDVGVLLIHGFTSSPAEWRPIGQFLNELIRPEGAQLILDRVKSSDKQLMTLQRSGHVINVDIEWQQVAEETWRFVQQRS